jgi:hypothetical protein
MKTSFKQLQLFGMAAENFLRRHKQKDAPQNGSNTKLEYAIGRVLNQVRKHQETIQEKMSDIEIDLCVVDAHGVIQRDAQGNLQFTRDGIKARNKQQSEVLNREDLEIDPHYVAVLPADLTPQEREAFVGYVIQPEAVSA